MHTMLIQTSSVGMGLAPIRLDKRDQAQEPRGGEADGGKPHPYWKTTERTFL
ncbi:MAG: hypothetical protein M3Y39_14205 [Chloroflexota bacterium]|nr:hypothetical protein [Chloroflexota bacterium]